MNSIFTSAFFISVLNPVICSGVTNGKSTGKNDPSGMLKIDPVAQELAKKFQNAMPNMNLTEMVKHLSRSPFI